MSASQASFMVSGYGSKRDGVRQLYVMHLSDGKERRITDITRGRAGSAAPCCMHGRVRHLPGHETGEGLGAFRTSWRPGP